MRRISLALALVGAMVATGCGGGAKPSSTGDGKGTAGVSFTVTVNNQGPGTVSSAPAGLTCAPSTTCSATFASGVDVVLTATVQGSNYFNGWFGECGGTGTCTLKGDADKYVVSYFSATPESHPNFNDPNLHGPAVTQGVLKCDLCHGANLEGQGLAPACTKCHDSTLIDTVKGVLAAPPVVKTGLKLAVTSVQLDGTTQVATVRFTVQDGKGNPIDVTTAKAGSSTTGSVVPVSMDGSLRIALTRIDVDANGQVLPYAVLTPASGTPGTITMPKVGVAAGTSGAVVQNAVGDYTWTSPVLPKIDGTKLGQTHAIWLQATRQENTANAFDAKGFSVVNYEYNFVPSGGTPGTREIVTTAACSKCHDGFKAEANATQTAWVSFHGAARVEAKFCDVCHNPGRTSNPAADAMVFVHRIHGAEQLELPTSLWFHSIGVTYPQDVRNCKECHEGALQGDQYKSRPSRAACGSCHYAVDFATGAGHNPDGLYGEPANLAQADDSQCASCHLPAYIESAHVPVIAKDPNNALDTVGGNSRTNAAAIAAVGALPAGASRITTEIAEVTRDATTKNPSIKFRLLKDGAPVVLNTYVPGGTVLEPIDGFVGTIAIYVAMANPQDGIVAPADYNASGSSNLRTLWNGGALVGGQSGNNYKQGATVCTDAAKCTCTVTDPCLPVTAPGTLTYTGADGWYVATLTGVKVPDAAKLVTGGLGYAYSLPTPAQYAAGNYNTMPLTQTNVAEYPYDAAKGTGGLIVPIPNVWKVATGYEARRAIVSTAKCNACHGALGVAPNFHVGQRNDGPTCQFCHNPNLTNNGWAVNTKDFIHGLHAAKMRTQPFTWHTTATALTDGGYWDIEWPSRLNSCEQCHVAGSYDFQGASMVPSNLLWSTAASSTPTANLSISPYVTAGTNYGASASFSASSGAWTPPAVTTLVISPTAAACFSCHDGVAARTHMEANGGTIYQPRSAVGGTTLVNGEACLGCHGAGKVWSITEVHK